MLFVHTIILYSCGVFIIYYYHLSMTSSDIHRSRQLTGRVAVHYHLFTSAFRLADWPTSRRRRRRRLITVCFFIYFFFIIITPRQYPFRRATAGCTPALLCAQRLHHHLLPPPLLSVSRFLNRKIHSQCCVFPTLSTSSRLALSQSAPRSHGVCGTGPSPLPLRFLNPRRTFVTNSSHVGFVKVRRTHRRRRRPTWLRRDDIYTACRRLLFRPKRIICWPQTSDSRSPLAADELSDGRQSWTSIRIRASRSGQKTSRWAYCSWTRLTEPCFA